MGNICMQAQNQLNIPKENSYISNIVIPMDMCVMQEIRCRIRGDILKGLRRGGGWVRGLSKVKGEGVEYEGRGAWLNLFVSLFLYLTCAKLDSIFTLQFYEQFYDMNVFLNLHHRNYKGFLTMFLFFSPNPVNKFEALISAWTYSCSWRYSRASSCKKKQV